MTDYLVFPLNSDPKVSVAISLAIQRPNGFPPDFLAALESFPSDSGTICRLQSRTDTVSRSIGLLYCKEPAPLVFQGQIHRGDIFSRESTLGVPRCTRVHSSLRTTPHRNALGSSQYVFEFVYDAVYASRWRNLKIYGRRYFIYSAGDKSTASMRSGFESYSYPDSFGSTIQQELRGNTIDFGCGLHYGTVLYGNIGTNARLDFTVMGPAVNLA